MTRGGTTDTACAVTDADKQPSKAGYVFDESAANVLDGTIAGDGSTVLKVYFKQQFTRHPRARRLRVRRLDPGRGRDRDQGRHLRRAVDR